MQKEFAGGRLIRDQQDGVASILFNNPAKLNAMSLGMWAALGDIAEDLASDASVRILTLRGAGDRAFVAGADISEFGENRSDKAVSARYNATVARAETAVEALGIPTLALINGYCIGGGLGIALRCDLRIASAASRFAITPAKLGLGYGFDGVASLHRRLGPSVTADLLFTGRKLAADEALAKGICDRVVPVEDFETTCRDAVAEIAGNAPLTLKAVKAALIALRKPLPDRTATDDLTGQCFDSEDYKEGQAAFAEKRAPVFKGY